MRTGAQSKFFKDDMRACSCVVHICYFGGLFTYMVLPGTHSQVCADVCVKCVCSGVHMANCILLKLAVGKIKSLPPNVQNKDVVEMESTDERQLTAVS